MTTMEEIIQTEAQTIIELTKDQSRDVVRIMNDIRLRAKNILKTLEEGDPE